MTLFPVVVLAGGLATRLKPLTEHIPKSLVEINGEPFMVHQLRLCGKQSVQNVVLCLGHQADMIRNVIGDGSRFGLRVMYAYDGPILRGTAGAICQALPYLDEHFFVLFGDSYLTCDYAVVQRAYMESGKHALMTVFKNEGRWVASYTEFADGRIITHDKQHKMPRMQHVNYGLGVFHRSVFENIPPGTVKDLTVVYQELLAEGQLAAYELSERPYESGSFEGLRDLENYFSKKA